MPKDLVGQKFGMLTVIELEVATPWVRRRWKCKCDCGNYCSRLESTLNVCRRDGLVSNCGCRQKTHLVPGTRELCIKAGLNRKNAFVNGSNVQMSLRDGTISTNTSGYQGVSWAKNAHKWRSYIGYQNRRANLGLFEYKSDAIRVRLLAEDAIRENRFEEFYFELKGAKFGGEKKEK